MSFATAAQALLEDALPDAVIVTAPPAPTDGVTFDDTTARIGTVVYLYDGQDPSAGPFLTSTEPTLYAACYAPTQDAALGLAKDVRDALPARTRLGTYRFRPTGIAAPVADTGYNPPEYYSLVRFVGLGLYGDE